MRDLEKSQRIGFVSWTEEIGKKSLLNQLEHPSEKSEGWKDNWVRRGVYSCFI